MVSQSSEANKRAVGQFSTQKEAQQTRSVLEKAGFKPDKISIEEQKLEPKPKQKDSQAKEGSIGAAIAGAVLGSGFALFTSIVAANSGSIGPDVSSNSGLFTIAIATAGGLVGALGFGLMGALSGGDAPKEPVEGDREMLSQNYVVAVRGTEEEVRQATAILQQQGGQV